MIRVKICGITRAQDVRAAVRHGASAVGFVFAKSPRRVSVAQARRLRSHLAPWVSAVGVFVNESPERIVRIARRVPLDAVQLHGDEPEKVVRILKKEGLCVIRAHRVGGSSADVRRTAADAVLLDSSVRGAYGGTGRSFDWKILRGWRSSTPLIVSGGLDPKNVRKLLRIVRPFGLDVSSGVEASPGIKSERLIKEFMTRAH